MAIRGHIRQTGFQVYDEATGTPLELAVIESPAERAERDYQIELSERLQQQIDTAVDVLGVVAILQAILISSRKSLLEVKESLSPIVQGCPATALTEIKYYWQETVAVVSQAIGRMLVAEKRAGA
jgi:hypothetical protein